MRGIHKTCGCVPGTRCAAHRRPAYENRRPNSGKRGYDHRWRKYATWFKSQWKCPECGRDHSTCEECQKTGVVRIAFAVDHRIPHRGDQTLFWDHANHQSLCEEDHNRKSREERLS